MRSKVAADVASARVRRIGAMSPAERVALAVRLGAEGVAAYMASHGVDRSTAVRRIKATHRLGRRHSACASADEH